MDIKFIQNIYLALTKQKEHILNGGTYMIVLREIDRDNFYDVIKLSVTDDQKEFVASNLFSLAQAKAFPECICLAIYNDEDIVGFTMYCIDHEDQEYWIYRLMVDAKYQSKGYGKAAMELLIDRIKEDLQHRMIYISFEPTNVGARHLYEQLGFQADGRVIDGEVVYKLEY
ncbi:GNAT family N-acetyltransferase [Paenibacillus motobuensis]|uniref:GNAT family N-acetyltransferase n=1 Tax=Paenibacillus TaxID=44249 RepID=UPI002040FC45|nr:MULTISPECIES: GNAT family N-acetyltransferase [Paenibacillus]MCM3038698.1 GNAT family N-acetyltransferase [Paenibacillus lutimineralis]MCM3645802.1 GNAT family N-acetyltransferase [Paenibacillus motobuensis]